MERLNKTRIPDAINCSIEAGYSRIPNDAIRNPEISSKAVRILCILLSNKEGWQSHLSVLSKSMKEGVYSIKQGLAELEELGYLKRLRYRSIETKQIKSSIWSYGDVPWNFSIGKTISVLKEHGFELFNIPESENLAPGIPVPGKPTTNKINSNNTKNILLPLAEEEEETSLYITPKMFDEFWAIYPNKDGSKGQAKTKWDKICAKRGSERVKYRYIERAIRLQKKSEQWQDPKYIPRATTWLEENRWIDEFEKLKGFESSINTRNMPQYKYDGTIRYTLNPKDGEYYHANGDKFIE